MATPFRVTRRVEFHETDLAGIVHFSNFFRYMEYAEQEFLRSRGLGVTWVDEAGERFGFPRVSAACDFLRPIQFDDLLEIAVRIEQMGRKSMSYAFEFFVGETPVARGRTTSVLCRARPEGIESLEIPPTLRERLASGD